MILSRDKVIERLKRGETIQWIGGADSHAWMSGDMRATVRWDTLSKLRRDGIITNYGFPELHGEIRLKGEVKDGA